MIKGIQSTRPDTPLSNSNKRPPTTTSPGVLSPSQKTNTPPMEENYRGSQKSPAGWEVIRELDNAENWSERTTVISKQEHLLYTETATEIVHDLVDQVQTSETNSNREATDYSMLEDVRRSGHHQPLPNHTVGGTLSEYEYMQSIGDEEFTSNASQLDVDYLERISSNSTEPSSLARESLYVKFDPLLKNNSPRIPDQQQVHAQARRAKSDHLLMLDTPPRLSNKIASQLQAKGANSPTLEGDASLTDSTPTGHRSSPVNRTLLDISPGMATSSAVPLTTGLGQRYVMRSPMMGANGGNELINVLKYSESDLHRILEQVRQENREETAQELNSLRQTFAEDVMDKQKKMDRLIKELHNMRAVTGVNTIDKEKYEMEIKRLSGICEKLQEHETELLDNYEQLKIEAKTIAEQRDQALTEFNSMEKSFADFHIRYTKAKETVSSLQKSEAKLQQYINELETNIATIEETNRKLQEDASLQVLEANETYDKIKKEAASEVSLTKAQLKKATIQIASLERQLQQKEQEKAELSQICEDLMKELGSKS